ncbi:MAG: L-fuculose-phosphate aldolase [Solirubrobacteraceae bacterium]|jgi:L-fuculose-phosphate aldolase|nr:L-fuculose-phosphate aldolase [Solirubrobacteraceae bacterium]
MQELTSKAEREQVATACLHLAATGLVHHTAGNVSVRAGDRVAITPTGADLAALTAADVTLIDLAGRVIEGDLAPTSELDLHLAVYERYGAGAVVHTHAPVSTALSCVLDELPCVHYEMLMLGGAVRVAPYQTFATPELAAAAVEALDGRTAALLANHGTIAFGTDLDAAVRATELLEWAATVYWRAAQIGTPRVLDKHASQAVIDVAIARSYGTTQSAEEHDR